MFCAVATLAIIGLSKGFVVRRDEPGYTHVVDNDALVQFIHEEYTNNALDNLSEFVKIPSLSPSFDENWYENGALLGSLELMQTWAEDQNVQGLTSHIYDNFTQEDGSPAPPILLLFIDGTIDNSDTAFLYGHADKQPMMEDVWTVTKPMEPLLTDDNTKLYGRGAADDGYSLYTSILAVKGLQQQNVSHSRVLIMIETEEESGSPNLPQFLEFMKNELNVQPSFMSIVDSGGQDLEHFWETTSLRGIVMGRIRVDIVNGTLHSGSAGGIAPSPMRIIMDLISSRLEDLKTGDILAEPFHQEVTEYQRNNAYAVAEAVGDEIYASLGFVAGAGPNYNGSTPTTEDIANMLIRSTLSAQMTIIAYNHETMPKLGQGGQAIYPFAEIEVSIRTAPGTDQDMAVAELKTIIEADSPYGANVTFSPILALPSFLAPQPPAWLAYTMDKSARDFWGGEPRLAIGSGGSVPMMSYFQDVFGDLDVVATGVLSGSTGHHGPDEFLHIPTAERVTAMFATVLAAQADKESF
ncbi:hypothetical protein SARC_11654 [Sphaeroforma arctica JP610]|uniref:Peptidase M20 dimerisation domain-containing protein n=1 Tax=Sphaeroforma arctica JP610 TaxID=667725 RepID=A0A0L0FGB6_9EUKA|nr:hypothetical protein SARC_11654 [Sphaeroforma arctica JP610]KNC75827.1 hypothetical protein SARC_11654 [Sphaeroforma arctica JP610]|eukprot:XP_014149729.1 hypothetical protein SARC_11654 [Sphaeroforma arctica JP610]